MTDEQVAIGMYFGIGVAITSYLRACAPKYDPDKPPFWKQFMMIVFWPWWVIGWIAADHEKGKE